MILLLAIVLILVLAGVGQVAHLLWLGLIIGLIAGIALYVADHIRRA